MTFTNTSVRRTVDNNDNLHLKHCNDSESGSSTLSGYYVFNCVNFEEVDEAEFIIRGYYISGWWSATVRIILNICSTGMHACMYYDGCLTEKQPSLHFQICHFMQL